MQLRAEAQCQDKNVIISHLMANRLTMNRLQSLLFWPKNKRPNKKLMKLFFHSCSVFYPHQSVNPIHVLYSFAALKWALCNNIDAYETKKIFLKNNTKIESYKKKRKKSKIFTLKNDSLVGFKGNMIVIYCYLNMCRNFFIYMKKLILVNRMMVNFFVTVRGLAHIM